MRLTRDTGWQEELKQLHSVAVKCYKAFERDPTDDNALDYLRASKGIDEHFRTTGLQLL